MPEFMFLFRGGEYEHLSKEQMQGVVEKFIAWARKLRDQGHFKAGDELKGSGRVVTVQNGKIVDGPFTETKEAVGGYMLIEASSLEEAVSLAHDCPGLPYNDRVEIRPISDYQ